MEKTIHHFLEKQYHDWIQDKVIISIHSKLHINIILKEIGIKGLKSEIEYQNRITRIQHQIISYFGDKFSFQFYVSESEFEFSKNIKTLNGYYFYPGCGNDIDWNLMSFLIKNTKIDKFIFCDYIDYHQNNQFVNLQDNIDPRFSLVETYDISPNIFDENVVEWKNYWHPNPLSTEFGFPNEAWAKGYILQYNNNPSIKPITITFLKTEALGTFNLMSKYLGAPAILNLQDHGAGGFWTSFGGDDSLLLDIARQNNSMPQFLLVDDSTTPWPGYHLYPDSNLNILDKQIPKKLMFWDPANL